MFRSILERAAGGRAGTKGGRPSTEVVLKFRMLVLQSLHGLSLDATERISVPTQAGFQHRPGSNTGQKAFFSHLLS